MACGLRRLAEDGFFLVLGLYLSSVFHMSATDSAFNCHCNCDAPRGTAGLARPQQACPCPRPPPCPPERVCPMCPPEVVCPPVVPCAACQTCDCDGDVAQALRDAEAAQSAVETPAKDGDILRSTSWARLQSLPRIEAQRYVSPYIVAMGDRENSHQEPGQALLLKVSGPAGVDVSGGNASLAAHFADCNEVDLVIPSVVEGRCLLLAPTTRAKSGSYHVLRHLRKTFMEGQRTGDIYKKSRAPAKTWNHAHNAPEHPFEQVSRFVGMEEYGQIAGRLTFSTAALNRADEHLTRLFAAMEDIEEKLRIVAEKATEHFRTEPWIEPEWKKFYAERNFANDKLGIPLIVMAVNGGAMNMLANFLCSAAARKLDIRNLVVFVSDAKLVPVVEAMGTHAFFHESLGEYPEAAARVFGDATFARMMFLKVLAAYLPLKLGYDVLFQDADHVWLKEPWPYFQKDRNIDAYFMDDGSRDARFGPFFANSGFYFLRYGPPNYHMTKDIFKRAEMLGSARSHQVVVNQALVEAQSLYGVNVEITPKNLFVSGQQFHRNKTFMEDIKTGVAEPFCIHMCWTANSTYKVVYFREMKMWYLNDDVVSWDAKEIADVVRTPLEPTRQVSWSDVCTAGHQ